MQHLVHLPNQHALTQGTDPSNNTGINRRHWLCLTAGSLLSGSAAAQAPALMLAKVYKPGAALGAYWVSEKYDGIRGYWDGQRLWTRGGEAVTPPAWFTAGWPDVPMDGELWAGRGQFAQAVSTARQQNAADAAWRAMRFMVFDLPAATGHFDARLQALNELLAPQRSSGLQAVLQSRIATEAALRERLRQTVALGGEGLMLHRGDTLYRGERSDDLLKLKPHDDADARVVGHVPGQGRLAGMLGALLVEMPAQGARAGQRFKLGTGMSDADRQSPPPVGAVVTYRFRGLNDSGLPRFASYLRRRPDLEGPDLLVR